MKTKFNYQIMLGRMARNQFKLHNIKKEWKVFILFVFILKMLTWSISIFAGYNYFYQLLFPVLQSVFFAKASAIVTLIIIEVLTTIALAKFFKFLYRGTAHLNTTIALSMVVVALFGLSFISSTNGLAMRQSQKVDNTEIIIENTNIKKQAVKNDYQNRLFNVDEQISLIRSNPQGWTRGVRSTLLSGQLAKIDSLQKRKAEIRQEQKAELTIISTAQISEMETNHKETTAEAEKYYKIITWVMIIQFISSGALMFFWKRILKEDDEKVLISEQIKTLKDTMVSNAYHAAIGEFSSISNIIASQLTLSNEKYEVAIPIENKADEAPPEQEDKERVRIGGFGVKTLEKETEHKNTNAPNETPIRINGITDFSPEISHEKNVHFLKKHKIIVRTIKGLNLPEKESISNTEIKQIKGLAKRAKFKSKTLIREVYKVAVTVGLNRIDNDGNVNII